MVILLGEKGRDPLSLNPRAKSFSRCCWAEPNINWDARKPTFSTGSIGSDSMVQLWSCNMYPNELKAKNSFQESSVVGFGELDCRNGVDICSPEDYDIVLIGVVDTGEITELCWTLGSDILIASDICGIIYFLQSKESGLEEILSIRAHGLAENPEACTAIALSPFKSQIIASFGSDRVLHFHDLEGRLISSIPDADYTDVYAICWRTANEIILGNTDGVLRMYDKRLDPSKTPVILTGRIQHHATVDSIAVNPGDRNIVASGSAKGVLSLWDIRCVGKENTHQKKVYEDEVVQLKFFSNKKNTLASASQSGCMSIFNLENIQDISTVNKESRMFRIGGGFSHLTSIDISKDDTTILAVTHTGAINFICT